jgi:23S rRNA (guanine2445-N2)-methyltransferase / 23S rRNA (guanine2069-N7)-methyltransferase
MTTPGSFAAYPFFATCPRNTEGLLLDELRSLKAVDVREARGGVYFDGTVETAYRVCLWSRVASRVLQRLCAVSIESADDLYEAVRSLPWEDHLAPTGTLAVDVTSAVRRGPLAQVNTHFLEQRVKDGVVDRFRLRTGARPSVDLIRPDLRVNIHLGVGETVVSLDLSGDALHRRGYRLEEGRRHLKENG